MLNPELFIDEAHEQRLRLLAERVADQVRLAGFAYAPGVFLHWYVHPSWPQRLIEPTVDFADAQRFGEVKDAMEEALVKVVRALGFTTHHHEYPDWSGWEVRDPAEEQETS
jgi:hypothetical protein